MDARQRTTLGNRFRLALRVVGLTAGLLAVPVAAVVLLTDLPPVAGQTADELRATAAAAAAGRFGEPARYAAWAVAGSAAVFAVWAAVELAGGLFLASARKTAAGAGNAAQIALAVALAAVANVIGFTTHARLDLTRDKAFTLAADQVDQLRRLRADSPTTVVVLQLHKTAGTLSDRPDAYDYAAERKTVEKVRDLVDQLREFGPRFNVVVLDIEDERYERDLRELTRRRPGLADAIAAAPENSIFFYADGKVRKEPRAAADRLAGRLAVAPDPDDPGARLVYPAGVSRMSFADFYQLDKTASREGSAAEREALAGVLGGPGFGPGVPGRGNLVLIPRGKEAFVRRVLAVEERRPRVGLAVIHPYLTSRETLDEYSAGGLRAALEANGFEVVDIILKRWARGSAPAAAAYTYEESELDRVEGRYQLMALLVADREQAVADLSAIARDAERGLADPDPGRAVAAAAAALRPVIRGRVRTADQVREVVAVLRAQAEAFRLDLAEFTRQLADVAPRYRALLGDERVAEGRRLTDVGDKLRQYVADCDALIVPRLTVLDLAKGETIPPALFTLAKDQAAAIREFVAAGKPVLFALGPTNVGRAAVGEPVTDDVEALLPRLGIELGRQAVLTDREQQAMAERRDDALGSAVDVPPLAFDPPADLGGKPPNPVAAAFRVTARAVDRKLEVRRSGYRPVYASAAVAGRLPFAPEVMFTGRDSWNEDRPLADDDYTPKFDPPKPDDPTKGTRDEERRGPFPVGVAVEVPVPLEWVDKAKLPAAAGDPLPVADQLRLAAAGLAVDGGLSAALLTAAGTTADRPTVRVAAYGHGGLFTGRDLDPAAETLLLHTLNWQLRRTDRLPADVPPADKWRFPRVAVSDRGFALWRWGTFLGLPLACGYAGAVVLMGRKLR